MGGLVIFSLKADQVVGLVAENSPNFPVKGIEVRWKVW
jgi:hypothetical protein